MMNRDGVLLVSAIANFQGSLAVAQSLGLSMSQGSSLEVNVSVPLPAGPEV